MAAHSVAGGISLNFLRSGGGSVKKGDFLIIGIVCARAAVLATVFFFVKSNGKTVVVKQNNKVVAEYRLDGDRQVELGHNTFTIKDGEVFMSAADCKNQTCVKTGKISKRGECIVCLPNMVILEIR